MRKGFLWAGIIIALYCARLLPAWADPGDEDRGPLRYITISVPGVNVPALYQDMLLNGSDARCASGSGPGSDFAGPLIFRQVIDFNAISDTRGETAEKLAEGTRNFFAAGSMLLLTALCFAPPDSTKWDDKAVLRDPAVSFNNNVTSPPVWDIDPWPMNYIVHPLIGSMYYQVARDAGLGMTGSFLYSTLMSTFYWEYGLEAIPERASYQDLWATPLMGSFLGEMFNRLESAIKKQGGRVLGSSGLGSLCLVLLNPARYIGEGMNGFFNHRVFSGMRSAMVYMARPAASERGALDYFVGLELFTAFDVTRGLE